MKVLPNPIVDSFTLAFDEKINGVMTIRLIDVSGREVWKRVTEAVDQYNVMLRLTGTSVNSGVYSMQIQLNNESAATQVMVQH